jgi:protein NrfD
VFRFYTTLQPTSPMSWGSWVLVVVYPASALLILGPLHEGYPWLAALVDRFAAGRRLTDRAER